MNVGNTEQLLPPIDRSTSVGAGNSAMTMMSCNNGYRRHAMPCHIIQKCVGGDTSGSIMYLSRTPTHLLKTNVECCIRYGRCTTPVDCPSYHRNEKHQPRLVNRHDTTPAREGGREGGPCSTGRHQGQGEERRGETRKRTGEEREEREGGRPNALALHCTAPGEGDGLTFLTFFFIDSTALFIACLRPSPSLSRSSTSSAAGSSSMAAKMRA